MKNTELRIGNYVEIYGKVEKVVDVMCDCVNTLNIEGAHYGLVNPIPLTEGWLEKFGFEKHEFDNVYPPQYRCKSRLIVVRDGCFVDYGTSVQLKYVHKIQNLCFELTGEELKIKN